MGITCSRSVALNSLWVFLIPAILGAEVSWLSMTAAETVTLCAVFDAKNGKVGMPLNRLPERGDSPFHSVQDPISQKNQHKDMAWIKRVTGKLKCFAAYSLPALIEPNWNQRDKRKSLLDQFYGMSK